MVHAHALPGTPAHRLSVSQIIERAVGEARLLAEVGFDAVLVENMHDTPYVHGERLGPETTACMTAVLCAVRAELECPIGVQILSGGNRPAVAAALAAESDFVRCENFVYSHIADEGLLAEAEAGPLLRYRASVAADHVGLFCDIKKKHASHAVTADLSISDVVKAAAFFRADAVVVTGSHTGEAAALEDVREAASASSLPVVVGSGVTAGTVADFRGTAGALIVGSDIKRDGLWSNDIDPSRAAAIVSARDKAIPG